MRFEKIGLTYLESIDNIRAFHAHRLLSHASRTLFLWQDTMGLSLYIEEDFFAVRYALKGKNAFFFPCGSDDKKLDFTSARMNRPDFRLYYLSREDTEFLQRNFSGSFEIEYDRSSCEYLFSRRDYHEMKGGRYAHIRNELNQLQRKYRPDVVPLGKGNFSDALQVVDCWEKRKKGASGLDFDDYNVALSALRHFDELGLTGSLVYIAGVPSAVVIAAEILPDTMSIQIAKLRENKTGLLFYALRSCFDALPVRFSVINADDDLGIQGLRMNKSRMNPCSMNEVWRAKRI